jgi:AraC family transcriptional regulator
MPAPEEIRYRKTELDSLTMVDCWMPPGVSITGHRHDQPHACFVVDGSFEELFPHGSTELMRGSFRLSPSGTRHDLKSGPRGARLLIIHIGDDDAATRDWFERLDVTRILVDDPVAGLGNALADRIADGGETSPAGVLETARMLLAQGLRSATLTRHSPTPAWLLRARRSMESAFPAIASANELARVAGVHRVQFSRAFREHFGSSLSRFVLGRRVDRAWHLIRETDTPLSLIAFEAGFADQSHLSRAFKDSVGITPGTLRDRGPQPLPSWRSA